MITPSFSPTATERVLPKLALDFTTANLDPRVTFTRTTNASNPATFVNSGGYVTAATNNQPRFDYDSISLTCKGLLIEESRSNLVLYSQDFSNAAWTRTNASIGTSTTSPDGTSNGQFLAETAVSGLHRTFVTSSITVSNGVAYTLSVFVKANQRDYIRLGDGNVTNSECFFNISNGTVFSTGAASTASITSFGNGWYRCSIRYTTTSTLSAPAIFISTNGSTISYLGVVTRGIYIWGAQLEAGAFATSYIPTTSAALTRNADVATMTGTNFSDWWVATTGAANVSAIQKSIIAINPLFQIDDNTADNIISLRGNVANPELYIKATTDQAQIDAGTIVANTAYKLAGAWNTNSCAAAQNGAAAVTDTSATIPTVTQARIGSDGTNYANAWLQKINYWPQRITNNETQAFSK